MTILTIVAIAFGLSVIFDILLYTIRYLWVHRIAISVLILAVTAFSISSMLLWSPSGWTVLFFVVGLYRLFATLRIAEGRMHEVYLRHSARRSAFVLIVWQL